MCKITECSISTFEKYLKDNEKAKATVNKYITALRRLSSWLAGEELNRQKLLEYREHLLESKTAQTVNGDLCAINTYLDYAGIPENRIRLVRVQQKAFLEERRELSEGEYKRLLAAARARHNDRLYLLMMTLCGTGIRISELPYITVEAVKIGRAQIRMKGKTRMILIPGKLCRQLQKYAGIRGIKSGYIFRTRTGCPVDRANICHDMKKLCEDANVDPHKVFPHNFRHLFARSFYAIEKNLAHLADVLGHSRIETTRIYVAVSASAHERTLNKMQLII